MGCSSSSPPDANGAGVATVTAASEVSCFHSILFETMLVVPPSGAPVCVKTSSITSARPAEKISSGTPAACTLESMATAPSLTISLPSASDDCSRACTVPRGVQAIRCYSAGANKQTDMSACTANTLKTHSRTTVDATSQHTLARVMSAHPLHPASLGAHAVVHCVSTNTTPPRSL